VQWNVQELVESTEERRVTCKTVEPVTFPEQKPGL
jgi:hypothetical protein